MKTKLFNYIIFCLCLCLTYSCEKADLQKSIPNDKGYVTYRVADCTQCPANDCCCTLRLTSDNEVILQLCGTTDGDAGICETETPNGCETISGLTHSSITFDANNRTKLFCMSQFKGVMIKCMTSGTHTFTLTCQQSSPSQTINVTFTSPGTQYFEVVNGCVVAPCP